MKRVRRNNSAHRLAEYRHKNRLTQSDLAAMLGVSTSRVCQYEKRGAVPRLVTMQKIAEVTKGFVKASHFYE